MYKELSVNFHLWSGCNMCCKYCFNRNYGAVPSQKDQIKIVKLLCEYGFAKISFVGGEPTLCPWLSELIEICENYPDTATMLITNGSRLSRNMDLLKKFDWVGLSIDSFNQTTNQQIGRMLVNYDECVKIIKSSGCHLKINTVVSSANKSEIMSEQIKRYAPQRWKVLQVTKVEDQNGADIKDFLITNDEFKQFVKNHADLSDILIAENSETVKNSYLMIDSLGRFTDTTMGYQRKTKSILEIGVAEALTMINFNRNLFIERGGLYNWRGMR
jgi:radical S-adenosyl methionine domain-containing protein 2